MVVKNLLVGQLQTNCYLVWNETAPDCFIIDPGDEADFITTEIVSLKLRPQAILLTHGHFDHCLACLELKLNFNVPIYLNPKDSFLYQNASKSANYWTKNNSFKPPPSLPFPHPLSLGKNIVEVILTPGHTPGSVSFLAPRSLGEVGSALFVGDTLFETGVGRTDYSYSSASNLQKSLAKIKSFPENTLIYPGHETSPFFLQA